MMQSYIIIFLTMYNTTRDAACKTQRACVSPTPGTLMTSSVGSITYEKVLGLAHMSLNLQCWLLH